MHWQIIHTEVGIRRSNGFSYTEPLCTTDSSYTEPLCITELYSNYTEITQIGLRMRRPSAGY